MGPRRSGGKGRAAAAQSGDGGVGTREAAGAVFRGDVEPLGTHESHVGDAEKPEQESQVRLSELGARAGLVHAATRQGDDDAPSAGQAFRTLGAVAEGAPLDA